MLECHECNVRTRFFTVWITIAAALSFAAPGRAGDQQIDHDFDLTLNRPAGSSPVWIADWNFDGSPCNAASWTTLGPYARLYTHITDNDLVCTENTTCAWLFTDDATPSTCTPPLSFAPLGHVVAPNISDGIVSPWVSLATAPNAGTLLEYKIFPGNDYWQSRIALNISVRGKIGSTVLPWQRENEWRSLGGWSWLTETLDLSTYVDPLADQIQVRFRVENFTSIGNTGPPVSCAGPGPFLDDIRIGRYPAAGPVVDPGLDHRWQAQDAFPTVQNAITPGEHFSPSADIFGTCAFSAAVDLGNNATSPNLITADSITIRVADVRNTGSVSVQFYGAIVEGPHAGKAPPPYTVSPVFFQVTADNCRDPLTNNIVPDLYFVDLDDTYFRGGDVLLYLWYATDGGGGSASYPAGLSSPPASVAAAQSATGGLLEVSFLPKIDWAPTYLARIAADASGDLDPTPVEIAASTQSNTILYVQNGDPYRRSAPYPPTEFMYSMNLNSISNGNYDVYDLQGFGNTNNDIGARATLAQVANYELIVDDVGRRRSDTVPSGTNGDSQKIDQQQWYRDYLNQVPAAPSLKAGLWLIGENVVEEIDSEPLLTMAGAGLANSSVFPTPVTAQGLTSFSFCSGAYNFAADPAMSLISSCLLHPHADFDDLVATGTGVVTHEYRSGGAHVGNAVVMKTGTIGPGCWTTVVSSFPWDAITAFPPKPGAEGSREIANKGDALLDAVLTATVTPPMPATPTDGEAQEVWSPGVLRSAPNPFRTTTRVRYGITHAATASVAVYDVSGHLVRVLRGSGIQPAGKYSLVWDGRDQRGVSVGSGVYLCRLTLDGQTTTRRMILLR